MDDLSGLTPEDIDGLPFGYIALAPDGTVRRYNRYEADLARKDPREVLGRNFFREVAPCTQVKDFEGRFDDFVSRRISEPALSFDFVFKFRHGTQNVRIAFVRSPLEREVIVTVNRLDRLVLATEPKLEADAARGAWSDPLGQRRVPVGEDFWRALHTQTAPARPLHAIGRDWGSRHARRIEGWVQEQRGRTLREVELQTALECLSGSTAQLGLGTFDVHFSHRRAGLVLVDHLHSPFTFLGAERSGPSCDLLAGFHAGLVGHLSGRPLVGHELACASDGAPACRFLVGTDERLSRLLDAEPGSLDADLRAALTLRAQGGQQVSTEAVDA